MMNTDITVLQEIDWGAIIPLVLPVIFLHLILLAIALYDLFKRRNIIQYPVIWLLVIILFNTVGPIIYLVIGRRMIKSD